MHRWRILSAGPHDQLADCVVERHRPGKTAERGKTFLSKVDVEPGGGNPLLKTLKSTFCMAGWAAVLWVSVSLVAFFILGPWYVPLVADIG